MSDTKKTNTEANPETPNKPIVKEKDIGNGVILKLESFTEDTSKLKGFVFNRVKFKTAKDAADHFTRISKGGKSGDEIICAMVNSNLSARMRSQATQTFLAAVRRIKDDNETKMAELMAELTDEELDTIRKECNNILISEEDALEYTPGEREVSAVSGLRKQKDDLLKAVKKLKEEAVKLKEAGKADESNKAVAMAKEKLTQYYEIDKQLKEAEAKAEEDLLNLLKD